MFQDDLLKTHLETSSSVKNRSFISAEWNMNIPDNILMAGNYRFRKTGSLYNFLPMQFDINDPAHKDATNSSIAVDAGLDEQDIPIAFATVNQKQKLYYSLDDCLGRFRPRSGINKATFSLEKQKKFFNGNTINNLGQSYRDTNRPRYYMASKDDKFKYWTSFRTEVSSNNQTLTYGLANRVITGLNEFGIDDANPFVVYKENVPANRVVVKMQTNVGTVNQGNITTGNGTVADPLYGQENQTTPVKWKIQGLVGNNWEDLKAFDANSIRRSGSPIIGADGYVEIAYGLIIPEEYRSIFIMAETYSNTSLLPIKAVNGYAYLIKSSSTDVGTFHIWVEDTQEYKTFTPVYGWDIYDETLDRFTPFVTDTTSPDKFIDTTNQFKTSYRELQYLKGIRIAVETMNKIDSTFDLIEMSSRLAVNITDITKSVSVKKSASDLGISGLPVGELVVSTGSIEMFDFDGSFNINNENSIIAKYASNQIQFKIYDVIAEVLDGGTYYDYFVPIKTMYGEGFPETNIESRSVTINLRDMFSYFEQSTAPQVLAREASLSYAVSFLLDNIGFSNYVFKRAAGESEPIIPFFFVEPDVTVAEVLNELARSTQTAMFFDEYNNFVMMSKNYMLPTETTRATDLTLYGSKDFAKNGIEKNAATQSKLANIISIASKNTEVYNDGKINFTTRYIERAYSSIDKANKLDRDKKWTYKPSMLWEVSPSMAMKSQGGNEGSLSTYALTAIPLKADLPAKLPTVNAKGIVENNTIDFGDGAYWMGRYAGYFYANGEIIKYDAVQYKVLGETQDVWISSLDEYNYYFSKMPFNSKMYPTGLVRIYSKPFYSKTTGLPLTGNVEVHGREQFGTKMPDGGHKAGLGSEWTTNVSGITMDSDYLFSAIGNFQIKDGYVPYKATAPITVFGGTTNWTMSGPGTLSKTTGTTSDTVMCSNIKYDKEYEYSLSIAGSKVYSVSQKLVQQYNTDKITPIGDLYISNIIPGSTSSQVTFTVTVPAYDSFYATKAAAVKSPTDSFSWSLVGTGTDILGTITAFDTGKKDKLKKPVYDTTKTIVKQGTTVKVAATTNRQPTFTVTVTLPHSTEKIISLVVGSSSSDPIKTITVKLGSVSAVIGSLQSKQLLYDNKKIVVEDTTGIRVGQEVTLYTAKETLVGTEVKVDNIFDGDNQNQIRVVSVDSDTMFTIKLRKSNSGISDEGTKVSIDSLTLKDLKSLSTDTTLVAGGKTSLAGTKNSKTLAQAATTTGLIKNFMTADSNTVNITNTTNGVPNGTIQSSALVLSGPTFTDTGDPNSIDFITYSYKNLGTDAAKYKFFGTRMRIIGKYEYNQQQSGVGDDVWYTSKQTSAAGTVTKTDVRASSGGIAVLLNPVTNNGYYFEMGAVSDTSKAKNIIKYAEDGTQIEDPIHNLLFYKMNVGVDEDNLPMTNDKGTPVKLWGGLTNVLVDSGLFTGQGRSVTTTGANTVYDLGVEYEIVNETSIKFYLYVNNLLIGTVTDTEPFLDTNGKPAIYNNMALFVRGKAKCMFEHVYAIAANPHQTSSTEILSTSQSNANGVFGDGSISFNNGMRKYAISGMVSQGFLSKVGTATNSANSLFYDEFGTIMREAAYFNVRYDKAYPALIAKIAPTFRNDRGYVVSGFMPGPYSAEFLIFNATDTVLNLDGTDGNYLRIHGITFTQQTTSELTVDEYFSTRSRLSDPQTPPGSSLVKSPLKEAEEFNKIKNSRSAYGKKEFTLDSRYIQSEDAANGLMEWLTSKIMKPRMSVGIKVFSMPTIQLGDIVSINMKDTDGIDQIAPETTRFVVYQIDYNKTNQGPDMTVYLSEVV